MGITINPFTGQFDFTGNSGGGGSTTSNYELLFNATTDWGAPSAGVYSLVLLQATHAKGTKLNINVYELNGSDYQSVGITSKINGTGDITLEVLQAPDNRFEGKIIIGGY